MSTTSDLEPLHHLDEHLARWVADGVVSARQAEEIRAEELQIVHVPAPRGTSLVTEALGYLGGALVLVASMLLVGRVWEDLHVGGQLSLVGGAAAVLVVAGSLVPARPRTAGERLRSVLWLLSTAATAFFVGRFAVDVFDLKGADVALLVTGLAAVEAGALWYFARMFVQQAAFFGTLAGAAAASLAELGLHGSNSGALPGLGILVIGACWAALAGFGPLQPERFARLLGGGGTVVGSFVMLGSGWGRPVALVAVGTLALLGLLANDLPLLGLATFGVLVVLPVAMTAWFPGAVAAPLALLLCGGLLVYVALRALRARERR